MGFGWRDVIAARQTQTSSRKRTLQISTLIADYLQACFQPSNYP